MIVGHSLGGILALALATSTPGLVGGVVALDSVLLLGEPRVAAMTVLLARLRTGDYLPAVREHVSRFFAPTDPLALQRLILQRIARVPPRVAISV